MSEDRAIVSQELPPLPERYGQMPAMIMPEVHGLGSGTLVVQATDIYTADQLRAYARTAVEAAILKERERAAAITDGIRTLDEVDAAVAAIRARK